MDVLPTLRTHSLITDAFHYVSEPVTAAILTDLFQVGYSDIGSNRRAAEEITMGYFLDILLDMEGLFLTSLNGYVCCQLNLTEHIFGCV